MLIPRALSLELRDGATLGLLALGVLLPRPLAVAGLPIVALHAAHEGIHLRSTRATAFCLLSFRQLRHGNLRWLLRQLLLDWLLLNGLRLLSVVAK